MFCCSPGTRSGESAGGFSVGIVPNGSIFTNVSGIFTWAGEEVEILGERPRHSLRLLPGTEPSHQSDNKQACWFGHLLRYVRTH